MHTITRKANISEAYLQRVLDFIWCPLTHSPLHLATDEELGALNIRIRHKTLWFRNGEPVTQPLTMVLISDNQEYAYPVEDGIFILLRSSAILLAHYMPFNATDGGLCLEKQQAQSFYEQIGWKQLSNERYEDTQRFEDTRPVSADYISKCHNRVNRYLPPEGGTFLLDVASGPVQFEEYVRYADKFEYRVCVDLSASALRRAQHKLRERGIYLLADITRIPIRSNMMDAVISLHTIYHLPSDEQIPAFDELYRVLKPGKTGLVVYTWGKYAPLPFVLEMPFRLLGRFRRMWRQQFEHGTQSDTPKLPFHPMSHIIWQQRRPSYVNRVIIWRTVSLRILQAYIHPWLFGRQILAFLYRLEDRFPDGMSRWGQYPMMILQK